MHLLQLQPLQLRIPLQLPQTQHPLAVPLGASLLLLLVVDS
jgi:hypothetical protein